MQSSSEWILCQSKSFPGKFYYFNVRTGKSAWGPGGAQVTAGRPPETLKETESHNHPERNSPPAPSPLQHNFFLSSKQQTTETRPEVTPFSYIRQTPETRHDVTPFSYIRQTPETRHNVTPFRSIQLTSETRHEVTPFSVNRQTPETVTSFNSIQQTPETRQEVTPFSSIRQTAETRHNVTPFRSIQLTSETRHEVTPFSVNRQTPETVTSFNSIQQTPETRQEVTPFSSIRQTAETRHDVPPFRSIQLTSETRHEVTPFSVNRQTPETVTSFNSIQQTPETRQEVKPYSSICQTLGTRHEIAPFRFIQQTPEKVTSFNSIQQTPETRQEVTPFSSIRQTAETRHNVPPFRSIQLTSETRHEVTPFSVNRQTPETVTSFNSIQQTPETRQEVQPYSSICQTLGTRHEIAPFRFIQQTPEKVTSFNSIQQTPETRQEVTPFSSIRQTAETRHDVPPFRSIQLTSETRHEVTPFSVNRQIPEKVTSFNSIQQTPETRQEITPSSSIRQILGTRHDITPFSSIQQSPETRQEITPSSSIRQTPETRQEVTLFNSKHHPTADTIKQNCLSFSSKRHPTPVFGQKTFPQIQVNIPFQNQASTTFGDAYPGFKPHPTISDADRSQDSQSMEGLKYIVTPGLGQPESKEILVDASNVPMHQRFVNFEAPGITFGKVNIDNIKRLNQKLKVTNPIKKPRVLEDLRLVSRARVFESKSPLSFADFRNTTPDFEPKTGNSIIKESALNFGLFSNIHKQDLNFGLPTKIQEARNQNFNVGPPITPEPVSNGDLPTNSRQLLSNGLPSNPMKTALNFETPQKTNETYVNFGPPSKNTGPLFNSEPPLKSNVLYYEPQTKQPILNTGTRSKHTKTVFNLDPPPKPKDPYLNLGPKPQEPSFQCNIHVGPSMQFKEPVLKRLPLQTNEPVFNAEALKAKDAVLNGLHTKPTEKEVKKETKSVLKGCVKNLKSCIKDDKSDNAVTKSFDDDLRAILISKRKSQDSTKAEFKGSKPKMSKQETPVKKKVTFNLDHESISMVSSIEDAEDMKCAFVELYRPTLSYLKALGPSSSPDSWCILPDAEVLTTDFEFIDDFVQIDPTCKLLIPRVVHSWLLALARGCDRPLVTAARNVLRRTTSSHVVVQACDEHDSPICTNDDMLRCCVENMDQNNHLVLVSNDLELLTTAKCYPIPCFSMNSIKNGLPTTKPLEYKKDMKITIKNDTANFKNDSAVQQSSNDELNENEKAIIRNFKMSNYSIGQNPKLNEKKQNIQNENRNGKYENGQSRNEANDKNENPIKYFYHDENMRIADAIELYYTDSKNNSSSININGITNKSDDVSNISMVPNESMEIDKPIESINNKHFNKVKKTTAAGWQFENKMTITTIEDDIQKLTIKDIDENKSLNTDKTKSLNSDKTKSLNTDKTKSLNSDKTKSLNTDKTKSLNTDKTKSLNSDKTKSLNTDKTKSLNTDKTKSLNTDKTKSLNTDKSVSVFFNNQKSVDLKKFKSLPNMKISLKNNNTSEISEENTQKEIENENQKCLFKNKDPRIEARKSNESILEFCKEKSREPLTAGIESGKAKMAIQSQKTMFEFENGKTYMASQCDRTKYEDQNGKTNMASQLDRSKSNMASTSNGFDVSKPQIMKSRIDINRFYVNSKDVEQRLQSRVDEWLCFYTQIMEDTLSTVLQKQSPSVLGSPPWSLFEALQCIAAIYEQNTYVTKIIGHLCSCLYENRCRMKKVIHPKEFMGALCCGAKLFEHLEIILPSIIEIQDGVTALLALLDQIEDETDPTVGLSEPPLPTPLNSKTGELDARRNFVKDKSEVTDYLKKHFAVWKETDPTQEVKVFRTPGKKGIKLEKKTKRNNDNDIDLFGFDKDKNGVRKKNYVKKKTPAVGKSNKAKDNAQDEKGPKIIRNAGRLKEFESKLRKRKTKPDYVEIKTVKKLKIEEKTSSNDKVYSGIVINGVRVKGYPNNTGYRPDEDPKLICSPRVIIETNLITDYEQKIRLKIAEDLFYTDQSEDNDNNYTKADNEHDKYTLNSYNGNNNYLSIPNLTKNHNRNENSDYKKNKVTKIKINHDNDNHNDDKNNHNGDNKNHNEDNDNNNKDVTTDSGLGNELPRWSSVVDSYTAEIENNLTLILGDMNSERVACFRADSAAETMRMRAFEMDYLVCRTLGVLRTLLRHSTDEDERAKNAEAVAKYMVQAKSINEVVNSILSATNYLLPVSSGMSYNC